jgi:hypothetical protein
METNGTEPRRRRARHPVFDIVQLDEGRTLKWLAARIGYSHAHVRNVAAGQFEASERFRAECARVLGRDEDELFLADRTESMAAAG